MASNSHTNHDPLANIIYISVPDDLEHKIGGFKLDPKILLPVEVQGELHEWDIGELSWEMIVSAMLKILAHQPNHENADYYRSFIKAAKPKIVDELTEVAVLKAKNKDFDVAEEIFKALKGLLPGQIAPELNLALVYEQRADAYKEIGNETLEGRYTEMAFESYKKVLAAKDVPADVYLNAGFFYLKHQNYLKAKEYLEKFTRLSEDEEKVKEVEDIIQEIDSRNLMDTLFKEAYDFIRLGKEEEGIQKIHKFLKKNPEVWNAWFLLGWGYRRLGKYKRGKDAFEKAKKYGPPNSDTYNELAICLMELEEYEESRKMLNQALKLEPENIKIISNMGILSLKEGKEEEAESFFKTVLEIEPDDAVAKKYLSDMED